MTAFYRATLEDFLATTDEHIRDRLQSAYAIRGYTSQYTDQTLTWERDIAFLRQTLQTCVHASESANAWGILLEFSIPRKEVRIDCVLLVRDAVVILEAKTGRPSSEARRQIEEYALLLHYFHKATADRWVVSITVSAAEVEPDVVALFQRKIFPQLPTYWIAPVVRSSWVGLPHLLLMIEQQTTGQLDVVAWDHSPYFPVPSILEAAVALRGGLSIREIAHSEASEHKIADVRQTVQSFVDRAKAEQHHAICFLTGVPGSGKTLVGLSLAHSEESKANAIHFMSGNGPLVRVLQHLFTQESRRVGANALQARAEAKTLIENVHMFARYHTEDNAGPPSNHAIIFDEAQRAWNRSQHMIKFNRDYSEPEMLLRIMERHNDWAVVIALVGGGQEINTGEAGLEEWGRALVGSAKKWIIHASPEVLEGGPSTAGHRLFEDSSRSSTVLSTPALHLRTSNRSLRAETLATWVNCVLDGDSSGAARLRIADKYPLFLSRSLSDMKAKLKEQGVGNNRYGLVASSGAARIRADGLEPSPGFHAEYHWEHWYLAEKSDVRSSYRCEVFATEFEIQGLELDWVGLCWGGDLIWEVSQGWQLRKLLHGQHTRWNPIRSADRRTFRKNAYRVLLTRARMGMVIYVPEGDPDDPTCDPYDFESTASFLLRCGVTPIAASVS